jgi:Bacterial Ig-like domain/L,D-transpeptidase catalytic domain
MVGVAVVALAAAGVVFAVTRSSSGPGTSAASGQSGPVATGPIHVTSITPANHSTGVDGAYPIIVTFSGPVAAHSPDPQLTPEVPGNWSAQGDTLVFTPTTPFGPSSRVTVAVPSGRNGVRSASGALLTAPATEHFTTSGYGQLALAEMLAQQGYLPMSWSPTANGAIRAASMSLADGAPASLTPAGQAYDPPAGTFTWDSGYPSTLQSMWDPNQPNVILRGAVMAFESEHNMTIDGNLTKKFWRALFQAQQSSEQNQNGYTYAVASKHLPETLTIYHDGHRVLRSLTNTGIPGEPTVDGTFPVYSRFLNTIMSGTNPGGSTYSDPVQYVSYFNGGDAVHYFVRPGYGYPQSLGCVELPYTAAKRAFPYLTYGSLVTVTG